MRVEEEVCRYKRTGLEQLERFLSRYVSDARRVLRGYEAILVEHSGGAELLLVPRGLYDAARSFCSRVYTLGLHAASLRRGRLLPTLSLGQFIEHAIVECYVRLPERLVAKLTYGKSIVVDAARTPHRLGGECRPAAVLAENDRFVAWAHVEKRADKLLIKPLVDVGWYLRSGV